MQGLPIHQVRLQSHDDAPLDLPVCVRLGICVILQATSSDNT